MASLTKAQRDAEEVVKRKIVDGHRRGVCNRDGESVRRSDGSYGPAMTFAQKQALKGKRRGTIQ
jgi:hypothetical protein